MGISFSAPAGWKAQKQGNVFWLGSDTLEGLHPDHGALVRHRGPDAGGGEPGDISMRPAASSSSRHPSPSRSRKTAWPPNSAASSKAGSEGLRHRADFTAGRGSDHHGGGRRNELLGDLPQDRQGDRFECRLHRSAGRHLPHALFCRQVLFVHRRVDDNRRRGDRAPGHALSRTGAISTARSSALRARIGEAPGSPETPPAGKSRGTRPRASSLLSFPAANSALSATRSRGKKESSFSTGSSSPMQALRNAAADSS